MCYIHLSIYFAARRHYCDLAEVRQTLCRVQKGQQCSPGFREEAAVRPLALEERTGGQGVRSYEEHSGLQGIAYFRAGSQQPFSAKGQIVNSWGFADHAVLQLSPLSADFLNSGPFLCVCCSLSLLTISFAGMADMPFDLGV